jgi:hypothetical protein
MVNVSLQANQFSLIGDDTTISYSSTSISGRPLLNYKQGKSERHFIGDEIRTQEVEFGKLVTVTTGSPGDESNTTVTLLVPTVTLTSTTDKAPVDTLAVVTDFSRKGPAHQHYKTVYLKGTADLEVS